MDSDSILTSIKKLLGIAEEDENFDMDIVMHINTVLLTLTQLGVGPPDGFTIMDDQARWSDFLSNSKQFEAVKTYVFLKVRLLFDPPQSSSVIGAMNRSISELEWRINLTAETIQKE